MNKEKLSLQDVTITPDDFCKIIGAVEDKKISKGNIKESIDIVSSTKDPIEKIIEKLSKTQDEDQGNIDILIEKIIRENPKQTSDYKNGKTKILGFFIGQVLKKTDGADPETIKNKIIKMLDKV